MTDWPEADLNSKRSYDVAVEAMRERLEKFRCERIGPHQLFLGDCREILPLIGKVDAVVTDPPYGVGMGYETFDDTPENVRALAQFFVAWSKANAKRAAITCGMARVWDYPPADWILCWAISGAGSTGKWGFNCWQPILVYGRDPYLESGKGRRPDLIFKNETSPDNGHPCPKPLGFMKLLIARASLPSEVVLDPFMGSGTTGAACVKLGRKFIGVEQGPAFFEIACRRISDAMKQPDLFIEQPKPKPIQETLDFDEAVA